MPKDVLTRLPAGHLLWAPVWIGLDCSASRSVENPAVAPSNFYLSPTRQTRGHHPVPHGAPKSDDDHGEITLE